VIFPTNQQSAQWQSGRRSGVLPDIYKQSRHGNGRFWGGAGLIQPANSVSRESREWTRMRKTPERSEPSYHWSGFINSVAAIELEVKACLLICPRCRYAPRSTGSGP
jgi:hypothetical protein